LVRSATPNRCSPRSSRWAAVKSPCRRFEKWALRTFRTQKFRKLFPTSSVPLRLTLLQDTRPSRCAPPCGSRCEERKRSFGEFSLCLSRACLGTMSIFIYTCLKTTVFLRLGLAKLFSPACPVLSLSWQIIVRFVPSLKNEQTLTHLLNDAWLCLFSESDGRQPHRTDQDRHPRQQRPSGPTLCRLVRPLLILKRPSFYQDRLGTNKAKAHSSKHNHRFLLPGPPLGRVRPPGKTTPFYTKSRHFAKTGRDKHRKSCTQNAETRFLIVFKDHAEGHGVSAAGGDVALCSDQNGRTEHAGKRKEEYACGKLSMRRCPEPVLVK
jgi:hypothetical protein